MNRILAIAAVHEVLTERRDEVVELGDLLDRLRAMLVQGLGADKHVEARLTPVSHRRRPGNRARPRLQRAAPERARARRRARCSSSWRSATARSCSRSPTTASGIEDDAGGTGLSIVRALVRDELRGTLDLHSNGGLRAEVVFPA